MAKRVYLVYDYEEFCGAYSSFLLAKKAIEEHLGLVREYAESHAEKLELGGLRLEVTEDCGKKGGPTSLRSRQKMTARTCTAGGPRYSSASWTSTTP